MPHDHTGNFTTALSGVNSPELQVADNDYAVGLVIDKIAHSPYANNTLIFVIEGDAQAGGDDLDAHRSTAFIAGPFVKQSAVVSTQYNTINFLRTMTRILGLPPAHLTDAVAQPMADAFDIRRCPGRILRLQRRFFITRVCPFPPRPVGLRIPKPTHDAKYWAHVTRGFDFSKEDRVDPVAYNRILWQGLKGNSVYPGDGSLSETRKHYKEALQKKNFFVEDDDGD